MERNRYIDLCINAARKIGLVFRPQDVIWGENELCEYGGIPYYPLSYKLAFDRHGNALHACELHDLKANSVTVARLCDVNEFKNKHLQEERQ